ncbi:MAG: hypothetical protein HYT30_01975 [Parcubacteria group bacterium]|nr:hypothetical protein [Parcubacteria group bacterium]
MDLKKYFETFDRKPLSVFKVAVVVVAMLAVVTFALRVVSAPFKPLMGKLGVAGNMVAPMMGGASYDYAVSEEGYSSMGYGGYGDDMAMPQFSARNAMVSMPPIMPTPGSPTGDTAEAFEVSEYNATIETQDKVAACDGVAALKARDYVIFENANTFDTGCQYGFKVERERAEEILAFIKTLDPKELSESTYTIKRQVDDFTNETEVLVKKRASIDDTLARAIDAYDDITALATRTEDAGALAKIIDSKIQTIERLTQERININEQLDRLARAKEDQLDRLKYTHFTVYISENKYLDVESLGDSWKNALRSFVHDVNQTLQDVTINLIALLFVLVQYALYILILVFAAKYGWRIVKKIWES